MPTSLRQFYYTRPYMMDGFPTWDPVGDSPSFGRDQDPLRMWPYISALAPEWPTRAASFMAGALIAAPCSWGRGSPAGSGSVKWYRIAGILYDQDESPISGGTILLFRTSDCLYLGSATSDANGAYAFKVGYDATEYFAVAYKHGSPDIAGTTIHSLTGS